MEIIMESKSLPAWQECLRQTKRVQQSMESVVPDVNDDIGRILSVQTELRLTSKELVGREATVTGESTAAVLYVSEGENAVAALRLSQPFTLAWELAEEGDGLPATVSLQVTQTETRVLNPRKLAVTVEVSGELAVYRPESVSVERLAPEAAEGLLYTLPAETEASLVSAVCEKSFVLSEQFVFPEGKPRPTQLVWQRADFRVTDCQQIGGKALVKGELCLRVCTLSEGCCYPVQTVFTAPFSQLVDIGPEEAEECAVRIEPTSCFYTLTETMNGEAALDAELHAVAQLVCRCTRRVVTVADAYSNRFPCELRRETLSLTERPRRHTLTLSAEERLELPEDCADVLAVFPTAAPPMLTPNGAMATVTADILAQTQSGTLLALRRQLALEGEGAEDGARVTEARLTEASFALRDGALAARLRLELTTESVGRTELETVTGATLDESAPAELSAVPTLTAVRAGDETLWELAKGFHSSVGQIAAMNDTEAPLRGRMLLIPRGV